MYTLKGISSVSNFITAYVPFSICNVFFVSKGNFYYVFPRQAQSSKWLASTL